MVLGDPAGVAQGPLAGVLAGLRWAEAGGGEALVVAPCDTPRDLARAAGTPPAA